MPADVSTATPITTGRGNAVAGVAWMLVSCAFLAGVAAMGRYAALAGIDPFQVVFLRLLFSVVALSPVLAWRGPSMLRTEHLRFYCLRILMGLVGMTSWFMALKLLPVGEVTAIGFLTPLFATVGAALFLGEIVGWRRWTATLVGFCGALIMLRPGFTELGPGTGMALLAACAMGAASLMIKRLSGRDDPDKVVLISVCMQTPIALIPALFVWQWPDPGLWALFVGMGVVGTLGHVTLTRAFANADASLVMGMDFAKLPFAVLYGFVMFSELIDLWTWAGAGVIFAASAYNARREHRLRRAARVRAAA